MFGARNIYQTVKQLILVENKINPTNLSLQYAIVLSSLLREEENYLKNTTITSFN